MQVWLYIRAWVVADFLVPSPSFATTEDWCVQVWKRVPKHVRRDFDTVVILVNWKLWKERNSIFFDNVQHSAEEVFEGIREDISLWRSAGLIVAI
jgi:hypothetical protein